MSIPSRFKLIFFVPPSALEKCKAAIFAAGAGRYPGLGNYTECCFHMNGIGQFRPGDTANPHLGKIGELELVEEVRVETLCVSKDIVKKAVQALKEYAGFLGRVFVQLLTTLNRAHPYEEPAYEVYKIEDL